MSYCIVVMGVSGCGKTTIGKKLARKLNVPFFDGDDYHSASNIKKMSGGIPLTDEDRLPWLTQLSVLLQKESKDKGIVLACSALKHSYRKLLSQHVVPTFVYLELTKAEAKERLFSRKNHFMPAALIDSQFSVLESPQEALKVKATEDAELLISRLFQLITR